MKRNWNDKAKISLIKNLKMLRLCEEKRKEGNLDPLISCLGVKMGVNSVNV